MKNILQGLDSEKEYILFHDTETTGVKSTDRILQSAGAIYELIDGGIKFIDYMEENITPPVAIDPAAAAVHGIWYPDLEGAPTFENSVTKELFDTFLSLDNVYYCAHNSDFDTEQLAREGIEIPESRTIDTLQIARLVNSENEDIKSNGLQYLRYFYNFDMEETFKDFVSDYGIEKLQPHTALSDIAVLAYYFKLLLEKGYVKTLNEAVKMSFTPVLEDKVSFGNIFPKGHPLSKAIVETYEQYGRKKKGVEYFNWAIKNMGGLSADQRIAISYYALKAYEQGLVSPSDVQPMSYIAAAYLPELEDILLKGLFFNKESIEAAGKKVIENIEKKIAEIEKEGLVDESREYPILKRLLKYHKLQGKL